MQTFDDEETYSETYPEGGKDAWLVVAGAWCAMIPSMGVLNTLAVLQAWVSEHELKGLPESTIGWVFSTYAFFLYFCGAQVGAFTPPHHCLRILTNSIEGLTFLPKARYLTLMIFGSSLCRDALGLWPPPCC